MPLDIASLVGQIGRMSGESPVSDLEERILEAQRQLHRQDANALRAKLEREHFATSWLVARPLGALAASCAPPDRPADFSVAAADGSFIAPDRHNPVRYYVINTGTVLLTYGSAPDARLGSSGQFCFEQDELYIPHDYKLLPVEGQRLGMKMALAELRALLDVARRAAPPVIALRDGTLIFWPLQSEEEEVRERFLHELLDVLNEFRLANVPLASYISFPNSRDVVNSLRVGMCADDPVSCDACTDRHERREPHCARLSGVVDRWVFERELRDGHRTDLFESASPVLEEYGPHRVAFFYMNVGDEIARVEAPLWSVQDRNSLNLLQAVIYDQCRRERGYPPALKEAHEQAVISAGDRAVVEQLVVQALYRTGVDSLRSAKDRHKRERSV